ncbi:ATP-binding protein [Pyrococcus abyssi]|uniref:Uncharacterized protein n=1 Tax=Pyrococcus abyssi (strain GE5 / Orsay) TaxID=272844 RepID=Q9V0B2_PYRAB|nr:ATP-binding protein [Pyrococcus abyssi]CAB49792.1 Hypothetical protein PAB0589 [Pyrococcus abyssi GE5]CCE70284.1 TPA: hypothetical protein PAB0589 [Pyrococcus abyssi GE5]
MRYEVWDDVLDQSLDEHSAPELGDVITGRAPRIYTDPREFFKRTYFTDPMLEILDQILRTFEGKERQNVFLIYSLFGGGKTHTILTIYHAFRDPGALLDEEVLRDYDPEKREKIKEIGERISSLSDVIVVPVYGKGELPRPRKPRDGKKTIWGYIADLLGEYEKVRVEDETLTSPTPELIREIIGRRKVLFLIDEIVDYIDNIRKSTDEEERNYSRNVSKFLDHLATALLGSQSVMVMTIPMEEEGEVLKGEKEYDRDVIIEVRRAVTRVGGARMYSPVKIGGKENELVEILKRRIFKGIDEEEKAKVLSELREAYSNKNVFGENVKFEEIRKSYPFHPEYVEVLRTIIERVGLQRTRDLIRITRIVMRELLKRGESPALIMPHHIPLNDDKIKGSLFSKSTIYSDYWTVYETDINDEKLKEFRNPELARIILTYIFLRTYPYDSPMSLSEFPTPERIARGVYEPELFKSKNWLPVDIKDAVEEIRGSVKFMYLNKRDPYLWFWRVANVSQMVNSKVEELLDTRRGEVISELVKKVHRFVKERKSLVSSRAKIEDHVTFFKANNVIVTRETQEFQDTPEYKLMVLVRDDVDEDMLRKIIFMYGSGTRTYKNSIVVVYVASGGMEEMAKSMATIMACDEVKKNIREKFKKYGEDVVRIQMSMVEDIRRKALEDLESQIVHYFRMVAYPDKDGPKVVQAQASSKSVIENVYSALVSQGKIVDDFDFEWLVDKFEDVNVKVLRPEGYPVSELIYMIMSNPRLPMVSTERLYEAIKDAVIELEIGIERDGVIYFKKVYKELPKEEEKGNPPATVRLKDVILPREEALNRQVLELLKRESEEVVRKGNVDYSVRRWYEVYLPNSSSLIPLRSVVRDGKVKDEYFEGVLWGYIVERKEETPIVRGEFQLEVSDHIIKGRPGDVITLEVKVKPLGREPFTVELETNFGELGSQEVKLEGEEKKVTWTIIVPEEREIARIEGRSESRRREVEVTIIPILEEEIVEVGEVKEEHKGNVLLEILDVDSTETLELIPVEGRVVGSMRIEKPLWEARFDGLSLEVAKYILKEIEEVLGSKARLDLRVKLDEGITINDLLFEKLRPLSGRVTFRIKKGEGNE